MALAGVAHKIKIEPEELNFGVVFVGSTRERKLVITNEGTTTVTLETMITYPHPLQVTLPENPLTLGPSKSAEATVRFSATTSGPISGSVRLISGPLFVTVPFMGAAYTREEYEEGVYQACRAREAQDQQRSYGFAYSSMSSPSQHDSYLLFQGVPCLAPEELRLAIDLIEQDQWHVPDPPVVVEHQWDPQQVASAIQFLLGKWRLVAHASPADQAAMVQGWIQGLITFGHQNYDPNFAQFYNWLSNPNVASAFFQRLSEQGFWAILGLLPQIGPLVTFWQFLQGVFSNPPPAGQITPAQAFITLLVATMDAHSDIGAIQTVITLIEKHYYLAPALEALVMTGTLVGAGPFEAAGLTKSFYAGFLERLRKGPELRGRPSETVLAFYLGVLARGPNRYDPNRAEDYSNLMGGFMTLVNLVESWWIVQAVPKASLATGQPIGYCPVVADCTNIYQLVHVIARKNTAIGPVTVFVNVEAKIGPEEVSSIVRNIEGIIRDIVRFESSHLTPPWHGSYPVVVQVSFNAHTGNVEQIISRLGNPAVPVVFIFVNQNGVWDARAACPASGCPGGLSPSEFAKKIAEEMGYPIGKKYDPLTDLPPIFFCRCV
ncbi:MAG: choice-of-anchor D domain-containing protein [Candidatus Bipolaricaulota bacterium]|nr:choice-of-anchor D domain-containing protein [Candidatus Bipolaricaulota bacterium]MDW8329442.1 choice-of-anchor D domain-containing protein [Candidatus Bipolaricaulota bacterium]